MFSRADAEQLDATDPLRAMRDRFVVPDGVIYLDGNSLGALPKGVAERMQRVVIDEWGTGLIRSWNDADWYTAPRRVGARIAALVGAAPEQVVVCDSTSVNLYKVLTAMLADHRPGGVLITERGSFPTNAYIAQAATAVTGTDLWYVEASDEGDLLQQIAAAGDRLAGVSLVDVNYRSGTRYDMGTITEAVHAVGGRIVWDLCHSAGAMPVTLDACRADYAVGCAYKYLNGGPGAPAFVYVAERHLDTFRHPLQGWHSHAEPFAFDDEYVPAEGIARLLAGTSPQLGLLALEAALDAFDGVDMAAVRAKSLSLTDLFIALVDERLGQVFGVLTPRDHRRRGSQVALTHEHGYEIVQALIERNVIGDFRAPDVLRFGMAAPYVRHVDVFDAVDTLVEVIHTDAWAAPRFRARRGVT